MIAAGLGKAEIEFVASLTSPLFWVLRTDDGDRFKNGTAFFLDTGERIFGVTAGHVVDECFKDVRRQAFGGCFIGGHGRSIQVDLAKRVIDGNPDLDIATFEIAPDEVAHIGKTVLRGYVKTWPPRDVQMGRGVTYCGFPGNGRRVDGPRILNFGCVTASGIATSTNEFSISILIEREMLVPALGDGVVPENYDFGGISGGPVLAIIETERIRSWIPAGVIFQGPNPSDDPAESIPGFDLVKARPVRYIHPDGTLDNEGWTLNNLHRPR